MTDDEYDAIRAKAEFCLATRIAPSEYDRLTDDEIQVFVDVANTLATNNT